MDKWNALREELVNRLGMYGTDVFPEPPTWRHGMTVDACSARAHRLLLCSILESMRLLDLDEARMSVVDRKPPERTRLPDLFVGVRVQWFVGPGWAHGTIMAVYSDGTMDVESDAGSSFSGWKFSIVRREEACR